MPSLKKKKDFQTLREEGRFVHITHWLAITYRQNNESCLRWGWTLSKQVGNAVVRNRLKRWGRDCLRGYESNEWDVNFIFKIKKRNFYEELSREQFNQAMVKAFEAMV